MICSRRALAGIVAACSLAAVATVAHGLDEKTAQRVLKARQGLMQLQLYEAGPLFAMAKGDIPYDADAAAGHAEALAALMDYDKTRLFPAGTSVADLPGKTKALPAIWEQPEKFQERSEALSAAARNVAEVADQGQPELAAAVADLGRACGNCHDTFREDK